MFLREHGKELATATRWGDLGLICAAFVFAYASLYGLPHWSLAGAAGLLFQKAGILIVVGAGFRIASEWERFYDSRRFERLGADLPPLVRATVVSLVPFSLVAYFWCPECLTADFLLVFGSATVGLIFLQRIAIRFVLRQARVHGRNFRRVLVIGSNARSLALCQAFTGHPEYGIRLLGLVDKQVAVDGEWPQSTQLVTDLDGLRGYLRDRVVDDVFITLPVKSYFDEIQRVIACCEETGIRAHVITDFYHPEVATHELGVLDRLPYVTYTTEPRSRLQLLIKRVIDILVAGVLLVAIAPLLAICALLIRLTSPGPIFFRQKRAGYHGRSFDMYKLRTMYVDAESQRAELAALNEMTGPVFKIKRDPRVTPVGRWLRRYSLDELPQLWNVFTGDMSLVGPRPHPVEEAQEYTSAQRRRLSMRPGLTCIWQVSGRNFIGFEKWIEMDLAYIDNWSLALDAELMLRTIPAVLTGRGAY